MILRVILAWLAFIVAETIHGALRGLYIVPIVGDLRARQIGVAVGSCIALAAAAVAVRWIGRRPAAAWLRIGGIWTVLTLLFEVSLGRALGVSWDRIAADYDTNRGGFMILGIAVVFFAPYLAARLRSLVGTP